MINATDIRKGMIIRHDGEIYDVVDVQHITPGNWRAMVQAKMRNVKTGSTTEYRFRSSERVEPIHTEQRQMEFLYRSGSNFVFMDMTSYEELVLQPETVGNSVQFMLSNASVLVNYVDGSPVAVQLPTTVDLKVVETEPSLRGATVTNQFKPAKLETGLVVQVPAFVEVNETIRVDTRSGEYVERVK
ncbi:MAG: elongation factor P [Planctomycetota bacterium]|nr:elongation factor P [Planctomycetota bacterium]